MKKGNRRIVGLFLIVIATIAMLAYAACGAYESGESLTNRLLGAMNIHPTVLAWRNSMAGTVDPGIDFSGTWTLVSSTVEGVTLGRTVVFRQDGNILTSSTEVSSEEDTARLWRINGSAAYQAFFVQMPNAVTGGLTTLIVRMAILEAPDRMKWVIEQGFIAYPNAPIQKQSFSIVWQKVSDAPAR